MSNTTAEVSTETGLKPPRDTAGLTRIQERVHFLERLLLASADTSAQSEASSSSLLLLENAVTLGRLNSVVNAATKSDTSKMETVIQRVQDLQKKWSAIAGPSLPAIATDYEETMQKITGSADMPLYGPPLGPLVTGGILSTSTSQASSSSSDPAAPDHNPAAALSPSQRAALEAILADAAGPAVAEAETLCRELELLEPELSRHPIKELDVFRRALSKAEAEVARQQAEAAADHRALEDMALAYADMVTRLNSTLVSWAVTLDEWEKRLDLEADDAASDGGQVSGSINNKYESGS